MRARKFFWTVIVFSLAFPMAEGRVYEFINYNVQNLFDHLHDPGKNDWEFLPLQTKGKREACSKIKHSRYRTTCLKTDWTETKVEIKISKIKDALLRKRKKLPDFLALSEVENPSVVAQLARELGYRSFQMTESPDRRGIDVALLYNSSPDLIFESVREHKLRSGGYFDKYPTRNILEVQFRVGSQAKKPLVVFVNHWPSLSHPSSARLAVASLLKNRIDDLLSTSPDLPVVVLGDFNTNAHDYPHPFKTILLEGGDLFDVHEAFLKSPLIGSQRKETLPLGSFFYVRKMQWELLDRIFVSRNLLDGKWDKEVILTSYEIYAPPFMSDIYQYNDPSYPFFGSRIVGIPNRYRHASTHARDVGYSDHFPTIIKIKF